ncbi:lactonase family protein [Microlunatus sp. Y2014]|uniref:lactonase family protein n=1 Tax=Microlunatus sp. Y2014 TaxID=3418488 RepID=UPI003DA77B1C
MTAPQQPSTTHLLIASADRVGLHQLDLAAGTCQQVGDPLPLTTPLGLVASRHGGWVTGFDEDGVVLPVLAGPGGLRPGPRSSSGGAVPCHIAVVTDDGASGAAETVAVANYTGNSVGVVRVADATDPDGSSELVDVVNFGEGSHPHQVLRHGAQWVVSDLGLDCLHVLDPADLHGDAVKIDLGEGSGPRDAVAIDESTLVVALEVANAAVLVRLERDGERITGGTVTARVDLTGDPADSHPSQILRASDGRVHVLNRGPQTLCTLSVSGDDLTLDGELAIGAWPMDLVELDGQLVIACRDAEALVCVDVTTLQQTASIPAPSPAALAILTP